jgi:hypothetical protein
MIALLQIDGIKLPDFVIPYDMPEVPTHKYIHMLIRTTYVLMKGDTL